MALGQTVWALVHVEGSQKISGFGSPPLRNRMVVYLTPWNNPSPTAVTTANLVVLGYMVGAYLGRSSKKVAPFPSRLSMLLKVIGIYTDRSASRDFVLVFHSNYGPTSYRFGDKGRW